jgi:hypothetical protein
MSSSKPSSPSADPRPGTRHAGPEDLVLYALQFLAGEQAADLTHHFEHCAERLRELALVEGDLAACAFSVEPHSPPALARQRLRTQVARENRVAAQPALAAFGRNRSILASPEDEAPKRSRALTLLGWLGWILFAGLAVAGAKFYQEDAAQSARLGAQSSELERLNADSARAHQLLDALTDPDAAHVTLSAKPPAKAQPLGRVTYNRANGSLIFLADDLDPLVTGKVYELWLVPADGRNPIPAAVFHPDNHGNASVLLPTLPAGVPARNFGVSIEDEGGAQTPTPPYILAGSL